ncbi:hypothetical protein G9272_01405 [Streptomyces asoensis]|uniref:Uncharacterized protein n=1 Tax=Streptomyces asoensis TaxID=249586 RepID=A0A6M4WIY0_9ACTN|nr:hypothetical protein [Streptomyces asoensis]QJS99144.1 hypothetical protein G9272_01405 [Streptomyces asoensis]
MVFVGVHGERGRIDVTQADLGCGRDRASIYKTKRPAPLTCYECDWRLHLVHETHSAYDLWFLRHANPAPHCEARAAGEGVVRGGEDALVRLWRSTHSAEQVPTA